MTTSDGPADLTDLLACVPESLRFSFVTAAALEGLKAAGRHEELLAIARRLLPGAPGAVPADDLLAVALLANFGSWAANELGRRTEMTALAELQVAVAARLPQPSIVLARAYAWRALGHEATGRIVDAVADYERGLALTALLPDHQATADVESMLRLNLFELLSTRGDVDPGILDPTAAAVTDFDVTLADGNMRAVAVIADGDLAAGIEMLTEIRDQALARGRSRIAGVIASNIGTALLQHLQADAAVPHLDQALGLLDQPGAGEQFGVAATNLGRARLMLGDRARAVAALKQAWAAFRRDAPRSVKALQPLHDLGLLRILEGDHRRARAALARGLELYESLRADIGESETEHEHTLRMYRSIVEWHLLLSVHEQWADEVQELIERSKARFWAESLAALGATQHRMPAPSRDLRSRYRLTDAAIDRLVLNFFVGPTASFVVVRDGPQPSVRRIHAGDKRIEELVEELTYELLATPSRSAADRPSQPAARELAELLLRDVRLSDARSILILPDGPLWALPFDVVLEAVGDAPDPLPPVSLAPAEHIVTQIEDRGGARTPASGWRMVALGAPAAGPGVAPITGTRAQVEWLGRTFPGAEAIVDGYATRARLLAGIAEATHVHIAAHAFATPEDDKPYIVLSDGRDGPDRWYAADIAQLSLRAELVFLSACSTSVGRLSTGEGVASLGRAFLHAGADCVVSTLWPVSDRWSEKLVQQFYTQLSAGETVAVAARRAQDAVRRAGAPPRMGAALQVVGDGFAGADHLSIILEKE